MIGAIFGAIGSIGATSLTAKALGSFIPENASRLARIGYFVGIVGLSGAAGDVAGNHVKQKVDDIANVFHMIKNVNTSNGAQEFVSFMEEDHESSSN